VTWPDEPARVIGGDLRDQLGDGRPRSGAVLPSASQLAASYLVSRQSARIALRQLAADGLVVRVPGRSTLAAPPGHEALRASPAKEQVR
jgi:GntR family transcriptional regulator